MPCRNRADLLGATIDSILAQDYSNLECIVMDGGSTDGTIEKLEAYGRRIWWRSQPDGGPFDAINKGWRQAKGEILAWLNADDVLEPGAVSAVVRYLRSHPEVDVACGACGGIGLDGRRIWLDLPRGFDLERALIHYDFGIHQPACFMRRPIIERAGGLTLDWCHDHDLWLKIAFAGGRFGAVDEHLADCRVWSGDAHKNPDLMVPAVLRVIDRAFASASLPPRFRGRQRRARSNAYVRCLSYLWFNRPRYWLKALQLIGAALREDPSNLVGICLGILRIPYPLLRAAAGTARLGQRQTADREVAPRNSRR